MTRLFCFSVGLTCSDNDGCTTVPNTFCDGGNGCQCNVAFKANDVNTGCIPKGMFMYCRDTSIEPRRWFKHTLFLNFNLTCKTYIHTIIFLGLERKLKSLYGSFPRIGLDLNAQYCQVMSQ